MNLFQEMENNYKDFIKSANDFIDSCRKNTNEDEKIFLQFGEITEKKRWKDKIKAKAIEIKNRPVKDEFITASQGKLNTIIEIESLLEKE